MKISFSELNLYEVENFHQKILKDLKKANSSFTLNFSDVQKIDLNNIQLLLSIKKYCDLNSIELKLTHIESKQIKQQFKLFNVTEILGLS